jgi:hypothetical protein
MAPKQFHDLPIGAVFVMDRGIETGLIVGLNEPGYRRYVKTDTRKYLAVGTESPIHQIGTVRAKVWQPCAQPCAQPGKYGAMEGLRVWLNEYDRLREELRIFRVWQGRVGRIDTDLDTNYPDELRRARDQAAARLAAYASEVLDLGWLAP